ncbi:MAG: folate-binding protein [Rhodobacteraceae bacterium]|nr:folate-binding protein [Paracoccaceae bacterium]
METHPKDRTVLALTGRDAADYLQGLVTNDVRPEGLTYSALLTPQGKYLFDFFLLRISGVIHIDVAASATTELIKRLLMYKLRAQVELQPSELSVACGIGEPPPDAFADPRHPALGWRLYGKSIAADMATDWDRIRVEHCIPQTGLELVPNSTFILEAGFDRLNGVDFQKGCFVGQEVTARMKHKTELRRRLATVRVRGEAAFGTEILCGTRRVGKLFSQSGGLGIALLRFDRSHPEPLTADGAEIIPI